MCARLSPRAIRSSPPSHLVPSPPHLSVVHAASPTFVLRCVTQEKHARDLLLKYNGPYELYAEALAKVRALLRPSPPGPLRPCPLSYELSANPSPTHPRRRCGHPYLSHY